MNVVSFFAPRPEHPFYQDYRPYLALLRESCERFGHRHFVLTDDPDVADDAYVCDLPRSLMPAFLAAQLAYLSDPEMADEPTLFVGADCVLANDPAVFAKMAGDLVITVGDNLTWRFNSGAIFVPKPSRVIGVWAAALENCSDEWGEDQTALYEAMLASGLLITELPVDPYNLAPENPSEDCSRGVVVHFRGLARKRWMESYCFHWLKLGKGVFARALPNTPAGEIIERMLANTARGLPEVAPEDAHDGNAVLVGGGPSLVGDLDEIRRRAVDGQTIFALNGAAHFLVSHGIEPDYCVVLDARPENIRFVRPAHECFYLLASQCHADLFDALPADQVCVWHCAVAEGDVLPAANPPHQYVLAHLTVGLTVMPLVYMMGYRKFHLYGYDSSDADGADHAYEQEQGAAENKKLEVWCNGRRFMAGIAMYAQAEGFEAVANVLLEADENCVITVHGDGLLPERARTMMAQPSLEGIAA